MGKIYAKQILNGKYENINEVPTYWRKKTIDALNEMLENQEITQEEYNKAMGIE